MSVEIHQYDIGTAITITVKDCDGVVNLSSATLLQIIFLKPDKTRMVVTATPVTSGVDGKIRYITQDGDLDVVGIWSYEVYVEMSGGKWHSDCGTFRVRENI